MNCQCKTCGGIGRFKQYTIACDCWDTKFSENRMRLFALITDYEAMAASGALRKGELLKYRSFIERCVALARDVIHKQNPPNRELLPQEK